MLKNEMFNLELLDIDSRHIVTFHKKQGKYVAYLVICLFNYDKKKC